MTHQINRRQLDRRLSGLRALALPAPGGGWLRALRQALGMRQADLAGRLSVTEGAVRDMERAEAAGAITLNRLARAADALGCDLHYVLIPRAGLEAQHEARIRDRAAADLARLRATMALEAQDIADSQAKTQLEDMVRAYQHHPPADLWHE